MKNVFSNLAVWIITQDILSTQISLFSCSWSEVSGRCCQCPACSPQTSDLAVCPGWLPVARICISVSKDYFSGTAEDTLSAAMASQSTRELLWEQPSINNAWIIGVNTLVHFPFGWENSVCVLYHLLQDKSTVPTMAGDLTLETLMPSFPSLCYFPTSLWLFPTLPQINSLHTILCLRICFWENHEVES